MPTDLLTLSALRGTMPGPPPFPPDGLAYLSADPIIGLRGDGTNGILWEYRTPSQVGSFAFGWIDFLGGGTAGDKIYLDGEEIKLVASTPDPAAAEVQIGGDAEDLVANLVEYLVNDNPHPSLRAETSISGRIKLIARTRGLSGNLIPIMIEEAPGAPKLGTPSGRLIAGGTFSAKFDEKFKEYAYVDSGLPDPQDVNAGIKFAPTGAPTGNQGVWTVVNKSPNYLRPDFFGNYDDDSIPPLPEEVLLERRRRMLQAAVWVAANHPAENFIVQIDRPYYVGGPIRLMDGVTIEGTTTDAAIICAYPGNLIGRSPLQVGGWQAAFTPINKVSHQGDNLYRYVKWTPVERTSANIIKVPESESWRFPQSDTLMIRSEQGYYGKNNAFLPNFFSPNRITAIGTAVSGMIPLTLTKPVPDGLGNLYLTNGSNPISLVNDTDVGFPTPAGVRRYGIRKGAILRNLAGQLGNSNNRDIFFGGPITVLFNFTMTGVSLASEGKTVNGLREDQGPAFASGIAMLDCEFDIPNITARSAVFVNCMAHSVIKVGSADVWEKGVEIALGSYNSTVEVGTVNANEVPYDPNIPVNQQEFTNVSSIVNIGENSREMLVKIETLNVMSEYSFAGTNGAILAARAAVDCVISVKDIHITSLTGWGGLIVGIYNSLQDNTAMGDTQNATSGITVYTGNVDGHDVNKYVAALNEGLMLQDYAISFGQYIPLGSATTPISYSGGEIEIGSVDETAIRLEGNDVVFNGIYQTGNFDYEDADLAIDIVAESRDSNSSITPDPPPSGANVVFTKPSP